MQVSPSNGKSWRAWVSYKVDPVLQSLCSPYFHFVSKAKYLGETMVLPFIVRLPSHFPESFINRLKLDLVEHDHIEAILMLIISIFKWRLSNSTEKKNWQARVTGVHQDYTECWKADAKQVDMSPVMQSPSRDRRVWWLLHHSHSMQFTTQWDLHLGPTERKTPTSAFRLRISNMNKIRLNFSLGDA